VVPLFESLLGFIFIGAGLMLFCFPPKKINGIYGYRTPSSMKNEKNWAIANKYSSKLLIGFGLLLLIIGAVSKHILITLAFTVIFSFIIFVLVEKKLAAL
jgi:uncharacterized membrane protein